MQNKGSQLKRMSFIHFLNLIVLYLVMVLVINKIGYIHSIPKVDIHITDTLVAITGLILCFKIYHLSELTRKKIKSLRKELEI